MRRAPVPGTAVALCLMLVLGLVAGTGGPANADTVTKMTCVAKAEALFSPGLSAEPKPVQFEAFGSIVCRVKPNDPQVLKGVIELDGSSGSASCGVGAGWTRVGIALTSVDGDVLILSLAGYTNWNGQTYTSYYGQNDANGYQIGWALGDGLFLALLPAPLCAKAAGGRSTGGTFVFRLNVQAFPTRVGA